MEDASRSRVEELICDGCGNGLEEGAYPFYYILLSTDTRNTKAFCSLECLIVWAKHLRDLHDMVGG